MTPSRTSRGSRSFGSLVLATTATLIVACGAAANEAKDASSSHVVAKSIEAPLGVTLVSACTPTGPEICFNAVDDNCNGVIDEGCGVGTGALQFTIAWGDVPADVDLDVVDPAGVKVFNQNRTAPSGLRLDHDCPHDDCYQQNIENIYFEGTTDPPKGVYKVEVHLHELRGAASPVRVRLGIRVGSRSYGADVDLTPAQSSRAFTIRVE